MAFDFTKLLGPSTYAAQGVLATVPASGVLYVRLHAGSAISKVDWLEQGNYTHTYQFFRAHQIPASLCDIDIAGWLNTETIFIMGSTYTGSTATTTWSTGQCSIAGADAVDATVLQKAINGGTLLTLATVLATQTVTIDGITFTAHASTTTVASRQFRMNQSDTLDAAELVTCINDATYGVSGVLATLGAGTGEILLQHTASHNTRPVATASHSTIAVSTCGHTYLEADIATAKLTLRWRESLIDRNGWLAPSFFTAKTGTATTHAAFTDTLLTILEEDGAVSGAITTQAAHAGSIRTHTLNGAEEAYLRITNSDAGNAMITRVGAYRIPWS
jgi:hypothetical protein